jgi:hypothetical protein
LIDLLDGVGRHDQVAVVRLERWLRARGYDDGQQGCLVPASAHRLAVWVASPDQIGTDDRRIVRAASEAIREYLATRDGGLEVLRPVTPPRATVVPSMTRYGFVCSAASMPAFAHRPASAAVGKTTTAMRLPFAEWQAAITDEKPVARTETGRFGSPPFGPNCNGDDLPGLHCQVFGLA